MNAFALFALVLAQGAPSGSSLPEARPTTQELVKKLDATAGLKDKEKPFEISASLGRLYFGEGRYAEAQGFYRQAQARAESARSLFLAQRKNAESKKPRSGAERGCKPSGDAALASLEEKAKALASAKDSVAAAACLEQALIPLMEVEVMLGHTQFLLGDSNGALDTYTRALETFPSNADARYARGALLLDTFGDDLGQLGRAKGDLDAFLAARSDSPHAGTAKQLLARTAEALAAGGLSKLSRLAQPPALTQEVMDAFQKAPRTAEMERAWAKLVSEAEEHLARGRFQEALAAYKQVMPYQPENPRVRAGMAWTMIKLNRQPMAENVWRVAIQSPQAIKELAEALTAQGDAEGARNLRQRLKESVPSIEP